MDETTHETLDHKFRLLIKRPSWGYSKLERELMEPEQRFQHIYNPMHEAGFYTGGMFMQIEAPGHKPETYVFRPRTKSSLLTMLSTTALKGTTLLTYPGKVYPAKEPVPYDDELEYHITKQQYNAIREELQQDRTQAYNYLLNDSGLYAMKLGQRHGVKTPRPSLIAPLDLYQHGGKFEHRIRLHSPLFRDGEILTLFPRNAAGIAQDEKHRHVKSFEERLIEQRQQRYYGAEGFGL